MKKLLYLLLILPLFASCSSDDDNTPSEADLNQQKIEATQKLLAGTWEYDTPKSDPHRNREEFVRNKESIITGTHYFYNWDSTKQEYIKTDAGTYEVVFYKNILSLKAYESGYPNNAPDTQLDTPIIEEITSTNMTIKFRKSGSVGYSENGVDKFDGYIYYTLHKVF